MMRTAMMVLGAALWGLLIFCVGLKVNFPADAALERLRYELYKSSDGKYAIDAGDAGLGFPLSLSLSDVTVYKVEKAKKTVRRHRKKNGRSDDDDVPEEEPSPKATVWLQFEELDASIGLLALLRGKQAISFDTELYGGDLGGTVEIGEKRTKVDIEGADIDLSTMNPSGEDWDLKLGGTAALDVELDQDTDDTKKSTGTIELSIADLAFTGGKVMGMDLPTTAFTEAVIKMVVEGGKAEITQGHFASPLVDATLEGDLTLAAKEISRWRMRVNMKLKLGDEIDTMARMVPLFKNSRDEEGVYHLICTGTLSSPHCREDRSVAAVRENTAGIAGIDRSSIVRDGPPDEAEGDASMSQEDRRKARLDRIRERRERMRKAREERGEDPGGMPTLGGDGPGPRMGGPRNRRDDFPPPPDEDGPPGLDEPPIGMDEGPIDDNPDDRDVLPNEE